jgi:hypothetical protein
MTEVTLQVDGQDSEDPFPRVMAAMTEWARTEDQKHAVMAALFDVRNERHPRRAGSRS